MQIEHLGGNKLDPQILIRLKFIFKSFIKMLLKNALFTFYRKLFFIHVNGRKNIIPNIFLIKISLTWLLLSTLANNRMFNNDTALSHIIMNKTEEFINN